MLLKYLKLLNSCEKLTENGVARLQRTGKQFFRRQFSASLCDKGGNCDGHFVKSRLQNCTIPTIMFVFEKCFAVCCNQVVVCGCN